jgi:hypothetical protein
VSKHLKNKNSWQYHLVFTLLSALGVLPATYIGYAVAGIFVFVFCYSSQSPCRASQTLLLWAIPAAFTFAYLYSLKQFYRGDKAKYTFAIHVIAAATIPFFGNWLLENVIASYSLSSYLKVLIPNLVVLCILLLNRVYQRQMVLVKLLILSPIVYVSYEYLRRIWYIIQ